MRERETNALKFITQERNGRAVEVAGGSAARSGFFGRSWAPGRRGWPACAGSGCSTGAGRARVAGAVQACWEGEFAGTGSRWVRGMAGSRGARRVGLSARGAGKSVGSARSLQAGRRGTGGEEVGRGRRSWRRSVQRAGGRASHGTGAWFSAARWRAWGRVLAAAAGRNRARGG
jgi:hypothetical protein